MKIRLCILKLKPARAIRKILTVLSLGALFSLSSERVFASGETIFNSDTLHEIRLNFSMNGYWDSLLVNYLKYHDIDTLDKFMQIADVIIDGTKLDSVGVKFKGNYTYAIPTEKKPIKIDFNAFVKSKRYEGLRALNLSNEFPDPSMLRNVTGYKILRDAGLTVPRASFAKVYVNGKYKGLYSVIEQIDKSYLALHFRDSNGELLKGVASSLFYAPDDTASYYRGFEMKTKNNPESWHRLMDLCKKINLTPAEVFHDSLKDVFDFDYYVPVLAADVIFNNWDSYFFGQNYYIYRDSTAGKYYYLAWDFNISMNKEDADDDYEILPGGTHNYFLSLPLPAKILENKILKQKYFEELCRINTIMASESTKNFVKKMHALIRPALAEDVNKVMTIKQFDDSFYSTIQISSDMAFIGLLEFFEYRSKMINYMLASAGYNCEKNFRPGK